MGTYKDFYVMLAYEVDYEVWKDLINECYEEKDWDREAELERWFVSDGMSGTYAYFGKTLFHAKEHGNNERKVIEIPRNEDIVKVLDKYIELIGEKPDGIPKIIAFEHYH